MIKLIFRLQCNFVVYVLLTVYAILIKFIAFSVWRTYMQDIKIMERKSIYKEKYENGTKTIYNQRDLLLRDCINV